MQWRVAAGLGFAAAGMFVVVLATYLLVAGTDLLGPAAWDLAVAAFVILGVTYVTLCVHAHTIRELTRRIDRAERRAIMLAAGGEEPRPPLKVVR
ncbi:hypothetical protein [Amycolatopsis echigonensis]|uniref:Uncharacterized protein n=1 Tax=Amycolatopsis echigonensis TaxID=2576905 RepID=A0A8E2B758_9PSEU|nr:hypothetical protein [Amycolatopsis echigonensis]MBB2502922.1 hypothetical protein [Amycolatopsis echigonensis]